MQPPRDLIGYANHPPHPHWPNDARIAINFVINIEEGAEKTPYNHDEEAECYGMTFPFAAKPKGMRNFSAESFFEYGSRCGFWRLLTMFDDYSLKTTCFATGLALDLNHAIANYLKQAEHEVAGHGWRWIDYSAVSKDEEKQHIEKTISTIQTLCGRRPQGWYTGRTSPATRELLFEIGGFIYDSDSYTDCLPYQFGDTEHLIGPYTLECNDFRFTTPPGFNTATEFYQTLKDTFDFLYTEGKTAPKMMSIGLHPRISGHPANCLAVKRFIEYILAKEAVWIARRIDIAKHWLYS